MEESALNDGTLRTAFQSSEALSGSQEEVLAYEARLKSVLDEEAAVREAELREQEAEKRGRKEEKEITARRLLAKGMDIDDVMEVTELNEEQVLKIKNEYIN